MSESYRALRPARVLGKTDLSWTLSQPIAPQASDPEVAQQRAPVWEPELAQERERAAPADSTEYDDDARVWEEALATQAARAANEPLDVLAADLPIEERARTVIRDIASAQEPDPIEPLASAGKSGSLFGALLHAIDGVREKRSTSRR